MRRQLLHRPSPAMVVALIALFVAVGGGAYAAVKLPRNSVGTPQLKKNAVTGRKIKANAVSGSKVANDSLTGKDIRESSLGKVPSAVTADNAGHASSADRAATAVNATNASNADTVGGHQVKTFFIKGGSNTGPSTVLSVDGFVIKAGCNGTGNPVATVENDSGVAAELKGVVNNDTAPPTFTDLNTLNLDSSPINILGSYVHGSGRFTAARSDGVVLSVVYGFDNPTTFATELVCTVNGTATAS
jgi:hypothetical protein